MSRISLVSLFPLLMVPSSTDSLLRDACSSHLSKDSNLMFFIFQHMLWVTVDDSCAFIGIYAQVPIKMQAPQGVPIASRTIAYLVFGTKYSNSGWLNDISVSMLNSSQAKGQREKKGRSTKVLCNTITILYHDFWNHYLLLIVNHYLFIGNLHTMFQTSAKHFICAITFSPYNHSTRQVLSSSPFYKWGK